MNLAVRASGSGDHNFPSPFPRLFCLDVAATDIKAATASSESAAGSHMDFHPILDLPPSSFQSVHCHFLPEVSSAESYRVRFLCESEKGWHLTGQGLDLDAGNDSTSWLVVYWIRWNFPNEGKEVKARPAAGDGAIPGLADDDPSAFVCLTVSVGRPSSQSRHFIQCSSFFQGTRKGQR